MAERMQFGVFSVGDVTTDPTTGRTPTEAERIEAMVAVALKTEEIGLDVFATGEHHNPPFVPSSPTTMLGYLAARRGVQVTLLDPSGPLARLRTMPELRPYSRVLNLTGSEQGDDRRRFP